MQYLYGKLNRELMIKEYTGLNNGYTNVTVDQTNNTIAVDIVKLPHKLQVKEINSVFTDFDASQDIILDLTSYAKITQVPNYAEITSSTGGNYLVFYYKQDETTKTELFRAEISGFTQVQADWTETDTTKASYIKNKPIIDAIPTLDSDNLVKSGGVYSAIKNMSAFDVTKRIGSGTTEDPYQYLPFDTKNELLTTPESGLYVGGVQRKPDKNDYTVVLSDESKGMVVEDYTSFTTTDQYVNYYVVYQNKTTLVTTANKDGVGITAGTTIAYTNIPSTKYTYTKSNTESYDVNAWAYLYPINTTGFTDAQIAALNSGIDSTKVTQITTNTINIASKLDRVTTTGNNRVYGVTMNGAQTTFIFATDNDILALFKTISLANAFYYNKTITITGGASYSDKTIIIGNSNIVYLTDATYLDKKITITANAVHSNKTIYVITNSIYLDKAIILVSGISTYADKNVIMTTGSATYYNKIVTITQ